MTTTYSDHILGPDTHANRPAATAVPVGTMYSCSDHGLVYRSDGATWSDYFTAGDAAAHIADATDAHDASAVSIADAGGHFTGTDVEAALQELGAAGGAAFVGARAYNNTTQSIDDSTDTAITLNTEEYDTDAIHSTVSNTSRMTVPSGKGGKWRFTGTVSCASTSSSGTLKIFFRKNGTTEIIGSAARLPRTNGVLAEATISCTVDLVATDYIELMINKTGTDGTVNSGHASSNSVRNMLEAHFLG